MGPLEGKGKNAPRQQKKKRENRKKCKEINYGNYLACPSETTTPADPHLTPINRLVVWFI